MVDVIQVEAYLPDEVVMMRSERVQHYNDEVKSQLKERVVEVSSFDAFLTSISTQVTGRHVLIAIGDSRTGTVVNWPWFMTKEDGWNFDDCLMLNFGGWSTFIEERVQLLRMLLPWIKEQRAVSVTCIVFGVWGDMLHKQRLYERYVDQGGESPFPGCEEALAEDVHGETTDRLLQQQPADWEQASRWIARRILAAMRALSLICQDHGARFVGVLEPNTFPDYSPGYSRELNQLYEARENREQSLVEWCAEKKYCVGPHYCGPVDQRKYPIRTILENIESLWPQGGSNADIHYLDLSRTFAETNDNMFIEFDGLHFNKRGSVELGKAMLYFLKGLGIGSTQIHESVSG